MATITEVIQANPRIAAAIRANPKLAKADSALAWVADANAALWALANEVRLTTGPFSLDKHFYQYEPMASTARRRCCRKGTQGGWTEIEVLRTLHGMIHRLYPQGVLYMFPTTDDVGEFSKSRFNPLIDDNPASIGRYVKTGGKGTDTTSLKKIYDAFLYLRGARLSQKIGPGSDEKESGKLKSIPVDEVVFDEIDMMNEQVVAKAKGRLGHSTIKEEVYLSNPTLPDQGIDAIFQLSDQRYLFRTCECGHKTCAELSFPNCVKLRADGTGYIGCDKCGREVPIRRGGFEWVPAVRDNSDYMHGYQWSQLSSEFNDPAEILADFQDPPQGNMADVYRLRLGLPYVAAEDRLAMDVVHACCTQDVMSTGHAGPAAMGVDVGKIKHVVIGLRMDSKRYAVIKVAKVSKWEDIHDLAKRFGVRSAVIDIRPYEDEARRFQAAEPYNVALCQYSENPLHEVVWDNKTNTVKAYRTGVFDATHALFAEGMVTLPRRCSQIDEFARQVCGTAKVLETNELKGTSVYRYRKLGSDGDHYRNAVNYFLLAASGSRIASVEGRRRGHNEVAISDYQRI